VPCLEGNESAYVRECLDGNWVSSVGPFVERFERMVAECAGRRFAVATPSGTAALHVALLATGVQPDDEVLVSTLTFIASANAVRYAGAWPVFIDAEPRHWQIDPNLVETFLRDRCLRRRDGTVVNRETGRRVRAILPVHILGHPVDMDPILDVARRYGLVVIEDAAQGLGAKYKDRPVGSLGDVACFSFNGNKIVTSGGGGMVVTDDERLAARARHLTTQARSDAVEYIHDEIGYNYRLTSLPAAVGCAQLERLPEFVAAKRRIAEYYARALSDVAGISCFQASPDAYCTYWLFTVEVQPQRFGLDSRQLQRHLEAARIQSRPLWQPLHASPAHRGSPAILTGVADHLFRDCLSLPSSVGLTEVELDRVSRAILQVRRKAA
jgi:perosamine synthetase